MKYKYILASAIYAVLIWHLSSRPGDTLSIPGNFDKLAHIVEYSVLGFLLTRGLGLPLWWAAFLAAAAWGGIDEWHQSRIPLRDASVWDGVADALGALIGTVIAALLGRKGEGNRQGTVRSEEEGVLQDVD